MIRKIVKITESHDFGPDQSMYNKQPAIGGRDLLQYCGKRPIDLNMEHEEVLWFALDLEYVFAYLDKRPKKQYVCRPNGKIKYTAYQDGDNLKIDYEVKDLWDPKEPVVDTFSVLFDGENMIKM